MDDPPLPPVSDGQRVPRQFSPPEAEGLFDLAARPGERTVLAPPAGEKLQHSFPQFEILKVLGRGGMGVVYQARQKELDRMVALKLLPPELGGQADFAARFRREARAMARLSHPHIVTVHDFGQTPDGRLYLVMEYIEGANLHDLIRGGSLGLAPALALAAQICDALAYAHGEGIVHRDIKPANVLVDARGRAKVADFGLARLLGTKVDSGLTMTGTVMGTLDYMAPEQRRGEHVDHRADIYAVGVMLYEMLCREVPHGMFDPPSSKVGCDAQLDLIVATAMQSQPERRYQSTEEMQTALEAARTAVLAAAPAAPRAAAARPRRAGSAGRRYGAVAIAVLLVALAIAAWSRWTKVPSTARGETTASRTPAPVAAPAEHWVDAMAGAGLSQMKHTAGGFAFRGMVIFENGPRHDGAVRIRLPFSPQISSLKLMARRRDADSWIQAFLNEDLRPEVQNIGYKDKRYFGVRPTKTFPSAPALQPGEKCELELRAVADRYTLKLNGQVLTEVEHAALPDGKFGVIWNGSSETVISSVEYLDLGQTVPASAPAPGWRKIVLTPEWIASQPNTSLAASLGPGDEVHVEKSVLAVPVVYTRDLAVRGEVRVSADENAFHLRATGGTLPTRVLSLTPDSASLSLKNPDSTFTTLAKLPSPPPLDLGGKWVPFEFAVVGGTSLATVQSRPWSAVSHLGVEAGGMAMHGHYRKLEYFLLEGVPAAQQPAFVREGMERLAAAAAPSSADAPATHAFPIGK